MQKIAKIAELESILEHYARKGAHTNNYLLMDSYINLIKEQKVQYVQGKDNLVMLIDTNICYQVYYYINNISEAIPIQSSKPLMMEIVYRGIQQRPKNILDYWNYFGFQTHLTRDNLSLRYKDMLHNDPNSNHNIQIKVATSDTEAEYATDLFRRDLDKYTGDQKNYEEILAYVFNGNVLCAYDSGSLCGALQFEEKNNNIWLGHIAIDENYRGKGIANQLVSMYIEINKKSDETRYQLWVRQDNEPANRLYKRFGFMYAGKSTVSMIKF